MPSDLLEGPAQTDATMCLVASESASGCCLSFRLCGMLGIHVFRSMPRIPERSYQLEKTGMGMALEPACCLPLNELPPMDKQDALKLQDLTGAYNTGFTLADLTPEDSMCMFPTYSEAEAMLKPMTRAKKGALLTPTSINNSLPNAKRT